MNIVRIKIDDLEFAKGYCAKTSRSILGAVARNLLIKTKTNIVRNVKELYRNLMHEIYQTSLLFLDMKEDQVVRDEKGGFERRGEVEIRDQHGP